MPKLIPISEQRIKNHCWFCGTDKSVKNTGEIMDPCPWSENRYLAILICDKCAIKHKSHLKEYWDLKRK